MAPGQAMGEAVIKSGIGKTVTDGRPGRNDAVLDAQGRIASLVEVDQGPVPAPDGAVVEFHMAHFFRRRIVH